MSREKSIYFARLAEQGERYEDMIRYMKEVVKVSIIALKKETIAIRIKNGSKTIIGCCPKNIGIDFSVN